jgi:hypothetical protein
MRNLPILFLIALFTASCAPTPYQPTGNDGGHRGVWVDEGSRTVKAIFSRNSFTSKQKGDDYALLRALEVAMNEGYRYYLRLGTDQEVDGQDRTAQPGKWFTQVPWKHLISHTVHVKVFKDIPVRDAMVTEVHSIPFKVTELKARYGIK